MKVVWVILLLCVANLAAADAPNPSALPPFPSGPSPLQRFRGWLEMPPQEREKALAEYSPEKQKVLRDKLAAYEILPQEQRARRLNMLELRWYLRPLMNMPPEQRKPHLLAVPPPLQPMIMDRLDAWDKLDAKTRLELLASEENKELVMAYFAQIRRGVSQSQILNQLDTADRSRLRDALATWNKTSPDELQRKAAHIATFFTVEPETRARTLAALSPSEQAEIQRTLDLFARMPLAQRRASVHSFQKFATMSPEDRNQFLRNAARWREMTPQERETWKQLVTKLPPMPPEPEEPAPMPSETVPPPRVAGPN
jgi:hypothetical protein